MRQMQIAEVALKQKNCFLGEMHWVEDGWARHDKKLSPFAARLEQNELEVRIGD